MCAIVLIQLLAAKCCVTLLLCEQAYSELVPKPGNRECYCGRKDIWHKNTLGCMVALTLAVVYVAAASGHTVRGVNGSAVTMATSLPLSRVVSQTTKVAVQGVYKSKQTNFL